MKPCRECTHQVSEHAFACPQCGAPYPARDVWDGWGYRVQVENHDRGLAARPHLFQVPAQPKTGRGTWRHRYRAVRVWRCLYRSIQCRSLEHQSVRGGGVRSRPVCCGLFPGGADRCLCRRGSWPTRVPTIESAPDPLTDWRRLADRPHGRHDEEERHVAESGVTIALDRREDQRVGGLARGDLEQDAHAHQRGRPGHRRGVEVGEGNEPWHSRLVARRDHLHRRVLQVDSEVDLRQGGFVEGPGEAVQLEPRRESQARD